MYAAECCQSHICALPKDCTDMLDRDRCVPKCTGGWALRSRKASRRVGSRAGRACTQAVAAARECGGGRWAAAQSAVRQANNWGRNAGSRTRACAVLSEWDGCVLPGLHGHQGRSLRPPWSVSHA